MIFHKNNNLLWELPVLHNSFSELGTKTQTTFEHHQRYQQAQIILSEFFPNVLHSRRCSFADETCVIYDISHLSISCTLPYNQLIKLINRRYEILVIVYWSFMHQLSPSCFSSLQDIHDLKNEAHAEIV